MQIPQPQTRLGGATPEPQIPKIRTGYIRTKKQLREILENMKEGECLTLYKAKFWCKDGGYHYELFVRKEEGKYYIKRTGYHSSQEYYRDVENFSDLVNFAWRWIKEFKTRSYML